MKMLKDLENEDKIKIWQAIEKDIRLVLKLTDLKKTDEILNFLDHNELGLAYDYLVGELSDRGVAIPQRVHKILQNLGQQMGFDKENADSDMKDCWAMFLKLPVVICISSLDVKFMLQHLGLSPQFIDLLNRHADNGLELNEDQADSLRDLCAEKLTVVGFDQNYELNELGTSLQALVDKLFID